MFKHNWLNLPSVFNTGNSARCCGLSVSWCFLHGLACTWHKWYRPRAENTHFPFQGCCLHSHCLSLAYAFFRWMSHHITKNKCISQFYNAETSHENWSLAAPTRVEWLWWCKCAICRSENPSSMPTQSARGQHVLSIHAPETYTEWCGSYATDVQPILLCFFSRRKSYSLLFATRSYLYVCNHVSFG